MTKHAITTLRKIAREVALSASAERHRTFLEVENRIRTIRGNLGGYDGRFAAELADAECELEGLRAAIEDERA